MQLSMKMLVDNLKGYNMKCDIRSDSRNIINARLYSDRINNSPTTLYLVQSDDNTVTCTNNNDIIYLEADDVDAALNDILDIFDRYNNFEHEMILKVDSGCYVNELMQEISQLTGWFVILADAGFYMTAYQGPEDVLKFHKELSSMLKTHMIPLDSIKKLNDSPEVRMREIAPYTIFVPELGTALTYNIFVGRNHMGWLVACNKTGVYSDGERDLLSAIAPVVERWIEKNTEAVKHSRKAGIFLSLLDGAEPGEDYMNSRLSAFGWGKNDKKQVYVLKKISAISLPEDIVERRLELAFSNSFVLSYAGSLVLITNLTINNIRQIESTLIGLLKEMRYCAGAGEAVEKIVDVPMCYRGASMASEYAPSEPGRIMQFKESVLPYTFSILKEHTTPNLCHPALDLLSEYDKRHDTDFYETLNVYLRNSQNATSTAKELFIHRSTLLYRIERIEEITDVDFSNPDERFHLQLSYYLNRK